MTARAQESAGNDEELVERMRERLRPLLPQPTGIEERLVPFPGVRAVLFDVYGTLFVSESGDLGGTFEIGRSAAALAAALESAGISGDLVVAGRRGAALLEQEIGAAHERRRREGCNDPEVDIRAVWKAVLETLVAEGLVAGETGIATIRRCAVEYECRVNPVWPMVDLWQLLEALGRKNLVLGIVSNAQFYTPLLLRLFLGAPLDRAGFDEDLCAWSYEILEAKPSVALFRAPLERLERRYGIRPEAALYVGNDMLNDMRAAQQVGLKTALFAGDRRSYRPRLDDERCAGIVPDAVLTDLARLPALLERRPR
jgi:putative hydrolase of the HAD superfamily